MLVDGRNYFLSINKGAGGEGKGERGGMFLGEENEGVPVPA